MLPVSLLACFMVCGCVILSSALNNTDSHQRSRRALAFDFDRRRLTFPPGSTFLITPTLAIPFIRNLPTGFASDMTISAPFSMKMDDLGLTDPANPWGLIPGISVGREASRSYQEHRHRLKRSPHLYNPHPLGDRKVLFEIIEEYLYNLGHNGAACLKRAICEFHEHPLPYYGLFGEVLSTIFSVSDSPFANEVLVDYVAAEKSGRQHQVCHQYFPECPISMFGEVNRSADKYLEGSAPSAVNSSLKKGVRQQKWPGSNSILLT